LLQCSRAKKAFGDLGERNRVRGNARRAGDALLSFCAPLRTEHPRRGLRDFHEQTARRITGQITSKSPPHGFGFDPGADFFRIKKIFPLATFLGARKFSGNIFPPIRHSIRTRIF
jgi:hypothetical protein